MSKKVSSFKPAKHKWLAGIIRIDTPTGAREACRELSERWDDGFSMLTGHIQPSISYERMRKGHRLLIRSASEAIRRSKAQLARKNLSPSERKEFKEIVRIYKVWLSKHRLK